LSLLNDILYNLEKCRQSRSIVLIHCLAGISRSPTLAIGYLMKHMSLKSDEAYKFVKEKRTTISPNFNFLGQLYEYEKELLKIDKEEKSEYKPCSNQDEAILNLNKNFRNAPVEKFENQVSTDFSLKFNPNRKKQFVFNFDDSNPTSSIIRPLQNDSTPQSSSKYSNEHCLSAISCKSSIKSNILLAQPFTINSLPSPSQAFSKFNLNSPTNSQLNIASSYKLNIDLTKTNDVKSNVARIRNEFNTDNLQETKMNDSFDNNNLSKISNPSSSDLKSEIEKNYNLYPRINSLKRPSSILLNVKNNSNSKSQDMMESMDKITNNTEVFNKYNHDKDQKCKELKHDLNFVVSLSRTLSSTSASSTSSSCSCCSFVSTSSVSSNTSHLCNSCSLNISQQHVNSGVHHPYQKKMKLSPIKDSKTLNEAIKPLSFDTNNSNLKNELNAFTLISDEKKDIKIDKAGINIKTQEVSYSSRLDEENLVKIELPYTNSKNNIINISNSLPALNNLNFLNDFMNEKNKNKHSEKVGRQSLIQKESDEESNEINKSTISCSLNSINITNNDIKGKTSSSASSSKTSSLHGSVETMIEVT
jgi:hypothetical protein